MSPMPLQTERRERHGGNPTCSPKKDYKGVKKRATAAGSSRAEVQIKTNLLQSCAPVGVLQQPHRADVVACKVCLAGAQAWVPVSKQA
eukprot:355436-Chlamydomonas_euryale.AAC.1